MTELIITMLAGLGVPALTLLIKYYLDAKDAHSKKYVEVKNSNGKKFSLIVEGKVEEELIRKLLKEEYAFEDQVERILKNYKAKNESFKYFKNSHVDFILEMNNKTIALEAKTNSNRPLKLHYEKVKENHPEVDELLFLFNSEIPKKYFDEYKGKNDVKFISSPRGKALSNKITNVLDQEFIKSHITKPSR